MAYATNGGEFFADARYVHGFSDLYNAPVVDLNLKNKGIGVTVDIVGLLSKDFLKLVLLATLIGLPLSWYGMSTWLQEYHYRTELHWWIFVLAGIIALSIAFITVSFQTFKAALSNPIDAIKIE